MNKDLFSFKKLFFAYLFAMIPFSLLGGILSLFNIVPVNFNGNPTYGFKGFIVAILFTPFIALMFSGLNWLFLNLGVLIYRLFSKQR
ncbi:hypothetical protein GM921_00775 [Pedobacter sp. LMG 31464]|uniref:Uncharacterized protein n=1 Tax=Pedobacter planticolens TaxID=2679964 RepID=A0A923DUB8_9SPHI|nr:hypothetical protein [Pedobacter planticolens]MBB2144004.1 hypothetical protein [Pedobacter planticolens]